MQSCLSHVSRKWLRTVGSVPWRTRCSLVCLMFPGSGSVQWVRFPGGLDAVLSVSCFQEVAPYSGFGSLEDSMQSCLSHVSRKWLRTVGSVPWRTRCSLVCLMFPGSGSVQWVRFPGGLDAVLSVSCFQEVAPYSGFGSLEDSMQSCLSHVSRKWLRTVGSVPWRTRCSLVCLMFPGSGSVQWVRFPGGLNAVVSVARSATTEEGLHQDARQRPQEP